MINTQSKELILALDIANETLCLTCESLGGL